MASLAASVGSIFRFLHRAFRFVGILGAATQDQGSEGASSLVLLIPTSREDLGSFSTGEKSLLPHPPAVSESDSKGRVSRSSPSRALSVWLAVQPYDSCRKDRSRTHRPAVGFDIAHKPDANHRT